MPKWTEISVAEPKFSIAAVVDLEKCTPFMETLGSAAFGQVLQSLFVTLNDALDGDEDRFLSFDDVQPYHIKFLGDGLLILWECKDGTSENGRDFYLDLVGALHGARSSFVDDRQLLQRQLNLPRIPPRIRVGVAWGDVYAVQGVSEQREYLGVPLNLASRLEGYCHDLGFLASARYVSSEAIEDERLLSVQTGTKPRGFSDPEWVIVDRTDFRALSKEAHERLFSSSDSE